MEQNEIIILTLIAGVLIIGFIKIKHFLMLRSKDFLYLMGKINSFLEEIDRNKGIYFAHSARERLYSEYAPYRKRLNQNLVYRRANLAQVQSFIDTYDNLDDRVKEWNKAFVELELTQNATFFDNIDGRCLDNEQRLAVVVDEDNNLVIAGAGSGKTLTISAKVKYLVDIKGIHSDEILLLSFTRKAAKEMQERISNRLAINVKVKTFHKLGLEIIAKARGYRPDVNAETDKIIVNYFKSKIINNKQIVSEAIKFFSYYLTIPMELEEVNNLGEWHDYYRNVDLETLKSKIESLKKEKTTINRERVKSYEEVLIANYLFLNGVNYEYEKQYSHDLEDKYRKLYRPDFYLPDYDMYIEHFGITSDNKVPWLSKIEEKKYLEDMERKRRIHKKNETILLETYSYYNSEGRLLKELEKMLAKQGVIFSPLDYGEIYTKLFIEGNDKYFNELKKLTLTFINLFKSCGYSEDHFKKMLLIAEEIINLFLKDRTKMFLSLIRPLYEYYQCVLDSNGQIDFNDMINLATQAQEEKIVDIKLKYIIIDEYQDMSTSRFNLIRAIRNSTSAKLVCVGDDWQSIYRFAGSDIDLFVNFSKYFGYTELLKIQKTYRNSQELVDIAGKFVMENPRQIKKDLKSDNNCSNAILIYGYHRNLISAFIATIEEIVKNSGRHDPDIMIIGRTNYDINIFDNKKLDDDNEKKLVKDFKVKRSSEQVKLYYKKYTKLEMNFFTAHRSKGLEADYVIIINLTSNLLGFPNKISDDPVLGIVLTDLDPFSYAEERRLFYVSITRTKNIVFLLAPQMKMSSFVDELIKKQNIEYNFITNEQNITDNPNCPLCKKGYLILRENSVNNKFLGCSNYPQCNNTFKHIEILNNQIECSRCGGYMVKRSGPSGEFYGCTNYPFCENTYSIEACELCSVVK
ncbi:MAG: UvrD-helicase domain-containing protein [Mobilitalea sp.]